MSEPTLRARIVDEPIESEALLDSVGGDRFGAALLFLGVVRDHNLGRPVSGVEYEAYREMAESVLLTIVREAGANLGEGAISAEHRIGTLAIGEVSVGIAVACPHRDASYRASRYIIEEIKKRLPVWKREHYRDGEVKWVPGHEPGASPVEVS